MRRDNRPPFGEFFTWSLDQVGAGRPSSPAKSYAVCPVGIGRHLKPALNRGFAAPNGSLTPPIGQVKYSSGGGRFWVNSVLWYKLKANNSHTKTNLSYHLLTIHRTVFIKIIPCPVDEEWTCVQCHWTFKYKMHFNWQTR